jgi:DNA-binding transcriptional LysR family regulator
VVSAPVQLGRLHVAPLLTELLIRHPALSAELLLFDRRADLIDEGIDVAVRVGHLPDSSLVALSVGEVRRVLCAAPAYLDLAPSLRTPEDLARHRCVRFSGLTAGHEWTFGHGDKAMSVPVHASLVTNQAQAAIDACRSGVGCGLFLSYQIEEDLRVGRLRRLLPTYEPPALPVHLVYPKARISTRRLRTFIEHVAPGLRAALSTRRQRSDSTAGSNG